MIKITKNLDHLAIGQNKVTGLFHGLYYRNKPTPSGCPRMILTTSTTQGYETEEEAMTVIENAFPLLPKIPRNEF